MSENNDAIEDFLHAMKFKVSKEEYENTKKVIKNLQGKDVKLFKDLTNIKNDKKCFAFLIDKDLCFGQGDDVLNPQYSHVIPINQLEKFKNKHAVIKRFPLRLHQMLKNFNTIDATLMDPIFVGFCPACEKRFTQDSKINIDSEINFTKRHMLKSLYRYLGKEIVGQELYIDFLKEIRDCSDKDLRKNIEKDTYNFILSKLYNIDNIEYDIKQRIIYKNLLKSLFLTFGTILLNEDYSSPKGDPYFELIQAEVDADDLPLIGQSFVSINSNGQEYKEIVFIFLNFIFDEKRNKTKCYMLIFNQMWNETLSKKFFINEEKKALFILTVAMKDTNHLYFNDEFLKINDKVQKLITKLEKINNSDPCQNFSSLINFIRNENINLK